MFTMDSIARSKETELVSKRIGLKINEQKPKYMKMIGIT